MRKIYFSRQNALAYTHPVSDEAQFKLGPNANDKIS
jgi:hypothetical protein